LPLPRQCQEQNIKCAIASASKNAPFILKQLKLENYFEHIVDAETLSQGKPDPEIFITAAEKLKIRLKYCVGIEDAGAGVTALQTAGIKCIGIGPDADKADKSLISTAELNLEKIKSLFDKDPNTN